MTSTASQTTTSSSDTAAVLDALRSKTAEVHRAEVEKIALTIAWAVMNEIDPTDADPHGFGDGFGDRGMPLGGAGAPWVSEFAAMEYAAALGMSTDAGNAYLGRVLELRYRLPQLWARVQAGKVAVWRAFRVADRTLALPEAGAGFVDRHLAPVAHSCSWAQLARLVIEATVRFDPAAAEAKRIAAAEDRCFDIHLHQVSYDGTVDVTGVLDLADALDLNDAINAGARQLAALGSTDSLDVRRSMATGELARRQPALDYNTNYDTDTDTSSTGAGRGVTLYVHLSQAALDGTQAETIGRCGNTRSPISVDQVRAWCGTPGTQVVVKPVIDLAEHIHLESYEVPDRLKEQNSLVDVHCIFPHCTQPAARCDHDHRIPHKDGGATCSSNTAPLCRRHHRAKTHSAWTYLTLTRGTYLWTSPHGLHHLRDHHGTHPI